MTLALILAAVALGLAGATLVLVLAWRVWRSTKELGRAVGAAGERIGTATDGLAAAQSDLDRRAAAGLQRTIGADSPLRRGPSDA